MRRYFTLVLALAFPGALTITQQGEIFTNVAVADQGPPEEQPRQGPIARKSQVRVGNSLNLHREQQGQSKVQQGQGVGSSQPPFAPFRSGTQMNFVLGFASTRALKNRLRLRLDAVRLG